VQCLKLSFADGYKRNALISAEVNTIEVFTPKLEEAMTKATIPALERAYTAALDPSRIKAVIISSPSGRICRCYPPEVLCDVMDFCEARGLHYISDEVFGNCVFDPKATPFLSALSLVGTPSDKTKDTLPKSKLDPSRVHVLWGPSKDFGLCGIRMVT
jgi:aspartate/methionine/tyrosine aminotransferase